MHLWWARSSAVRLLSSDSLVDELGYGSHAMSSRVFGPRLAGYLSKLLNRVVKYHELCGKCCKSKTVLYFNSREKVGSKEGGEAYL